MKYTLLIAILAAFAYSKTAHNEYEASKITDHVFSYLDQNKDNEIVPAEWNATQTLPTKYGFLKNGNLTIPFSDVDVDKNGLIDKPELHIFISGLLMMASDRSKPVINGTNFVNFDKIQENAKTLFINSFKQKCKENITNSDVKWNAFVQCTELKHVRACLENACDHKALIHSPSNKNSTSGALFNEDYQISRKVVIYLSLGIVIFTLTNILLVVLSASEWSLLVPFSISSVLGFLFVLLALVHATKLVNKC